MKHNYNKPSQSYIAHLNRYNAREFLNHKQSLLDFDFPCVISNDFLNDSLGEYPKISVAQSKELMQNRLLSLADPNLKFFLYFIDHSFDNHIANFELGAAIAHDIEHIALIGKRINSPIHCLTHNDDRIVHYYDMNNFMERHFNL